MNNQIYEEQLQSLENIQTKQLQVIKWPERNYYLNGDDFFRSLWQIIDFSQKYVWIMTYAMDNSFCANVTLQKLISAQKRGVNVVLFVDDLTQYTNKILIDELKSQGGTFSSLNPTWKNFWHIFNQEFFRRHHEKLIVSDDNAVIGSSNIEDCYGNFKYGDGGFQDLNMVMKNQCLKFFRDHFFEVANQYQIRLNQRKKNQDVIKEYDQLFPDSILSPKNYKIMKSHQPQKREIQDWILKSIQEAKESIIMVQPYYYPIKSFENEIINAIKRGVKVELITSAKRDQPVYHKLKNFLLMHNILKGGVKGYEFHEKLLHMKAYLIDNKYFNVGSFNNDRWSWKLNNEVNLLVDDDQEYPKIFNEIKKVRDSSTLVYEKPVGLIRQFKIKFWELFLYLSEVQMSKNKKFSQHKMQYQRVINEWEEGFGTDF